MSSSASSSPTRLVARGVSTPSVQNIVAQFDNIHLSHPPQAEFIGGFTIVPELTATHDRIDGREKPLPPTPSDESDIPNSIPLFLRPGNGRDQSRRQEPQSFQSQAVTPALHMPVPMLYMPSPDQSLTMAYAKSAPSSLNSFPSFAGDLRPPYLRHQYHSSTPSSGTSSPLATPKVKPLTRPSSTPASPSPPSNSSSASQNSIQCHGTTKAGKRCTRIVKAPPLVSFFASASSEPVERFCFQHVREVLSQSGFYSHKESGGWVEFADWIPKYLRPDTQAALRVEMEKPNSLKDEPGYIYAYEIRDDRLPDEIKIKVGRAVKLVKRLDQWSKQCTSKEVIVRGWWPGTVEDDDGNGTSLLRGKIIAGAKGPFCHRLERLVHLELADLAVHAPYLESGFPNTKYSANAETNGTSAPSTPGRSPKPSKIHMPGKPCLDCGAIHKEIFAFRKVRKGHYRDAEWELLIQPVIAKWGRFVAGYV